MVSYTGEDTVECQYYPNGSDELRIVTIVEQDTTWIPNEAVNNPIFDIFTTVHVLFKTEVLRKYGHICKQQVCVFFFSKKLRLVK